MRIEPSTACSKLKSNALNDFAMGAIIAAVMDVVSSEARSGIPSELLYDDGLVLMAPAMGQLGRRVAEWRS